MIQEPDELDTDQGSDDDFLDADDPGRSDYHERMLERADYLRDKMRDEAWERAVEASERRQRPQDGRVCNCEDAPCCGHYDL